MRSPSALIKGAYNYISESPTTTNNFQEQYNKIIEEQNIIAAENAAKIAAMSQEEKQQQALSQYMPTAEVAHAEEREDTAITRQMQDMTNAGINPILMATNGWTGASSAAGVNYISTEAEKTNAAANKSMANTAKINATLQGISSIIDSVSNAAGTVMGLGHKKTSAIGFGR